MLRSVLGSLYRNNLGSVGSTTRSFSVPKYKAVPPPVHAGYVPPRIAPEDMPFLHHGKRPRYKKYPKFKLPHKRANKVMNEITAEAIAKNKASKPEVWDTRFRVGDAIEVETVVGGGTATNKTEKLRGVVMGIFRKKLDQSILIRDIVYGEPVETRIPMHSPLLRSIKVIEKNFVTKGRKKLHKAKLYYLRKRNPSESRVSK